MTQDVRIHDTGRTMQVKSMRKHASFSKRQLASSRLFSATQIRADDSGYMQASVFGEPYLEGES
jgi:hypothetical protein